MKRITLDRFFITFITVFVLLVVNLIRKKSLPPINRFIL